MFKKVGSVLLAASIVILLLSTAMITIVSAQEGTLDPNTPISDVDGILPMAESTGAKISAAFKGTGVHTQGPTTAGAGTTAAGIGANPESVIGADGRVKVNATNTYPSRAIAYLLVTWANNSQGSCTGWFIGPRTVATAGHCVYNTAAGAAHGWAKSIVIYPGRNGASLPYGSTTKHKLWTVTGWTGSANPAYDYGAIQTNAALGNTVGYFGYRWQSSNSFPGTYTVRGYPGDKGTGALQGTTMWTMSGAITAVNANRLWYQMDTYGGQSGSPLYHLFDGTDPDTTPECCYGVGIHTYGASVAPFSGNSATRITQTVFNNLKAWKASTYP